MPAGSSPIMHVPGSISHKQYEGRFVAPFNRKRPADESAKDLRRYL
jgi:hypothetical protein